MDVKELKGMARNLKEIAGGSEMDGRGVASGQSWSCTDDPTNDGGCPEYCVSSGGGAMSDPRGFANESLLSVEDVAELLKVPVSWVYERTRKRGLERIPGFRLGKYWRFRAEDIFAWLERQRSGGRAHA
jgi:excisionase family DNA binding protein